MNEQFKYDVFLSHSSKDKPAVRELAERLRRDGLRVWFDEWEIRPRGPVPLKIEDGLEQSRTLVLTMSANATESEWVTFERHAVMFRDLSNQERRFIPLRLDDAEIKDVLKQFAYVDWRQRSNEEYARLLLACRPPIDKADLPSISKLKNRLRRRVIGEHDNQVSGVALTSRWKVGYIHI
jgi:TIR domain-containing protein